MDAIPHIEAKFEEEVVKFRKNLTFDAGVIADVLNTKVAAYNATTGTIYESRNRKELLRSLMDGLPAIVAYIRQEELYKTNVIAAYSDANKRKADSDKDKLFWKGGATAIAALVIIYLALRMAMRLEPYVSDTIHYWL